MKDTIGYEAYKIKRELQYQREKELLDWTDPQAKHLFLFTYSGKYRTKILRLLVERQKNLCNFCSKPFIWNNVKLKPTLDHILPQALGGGNEIENLQAYHAKCNSKKGSNPYKTNDIFPNVMKPINTDTKKGKKKLVHFAENQMERMVKLGLRMTMPDYRQWIAEAMKDPNSFKAKIDHNRKILADL